MVRQQLFARGAVVVPDSRPCPSTVMSAASGSLADLAAMMGLSSVDVRRRLCTRVL